MSNNMRTLRGEQGYNQEHAAHLAGISHGTWSKIEQGKQNPTLATMHKIAGVLGKTLDEVFPK